jgi:chromosome partitioning protein
LDALPERPPWWSGDVDRLRTVTVANQKGGVGKTTETANLGFEAARTFGARVLIIGFDPQCNIEALTRCEAYLGGVDEEGKQLPADKTVMDVVTGTAKLHEAMIKAPAEWQPDESLPYDQGGALVPGGEVYVVPAHALLSITLQNLAVPGKEHLLCDALQGIARHFDLVLIDTNPDTDLKLQMPLSASQWMLMITAPELFSQKGITTLFDFVDAVTKGLRFKTKIAGIIVNQFNKDERFHRIRLGQIIEGLQSRAERTNPDEPSGVVSVTGGSGGLQEFAGELAGFWPPTMPLSTFFNSAKEGQMPMSGHLKIIGQTKGVSGLDKHNVKRNVLPVVPFLVQQALKLLQLTQAPCLGRALEYLRSQNLEGVEGVWPTPVAGPEVAYLSQQSLLPQQPTTSKSDDPVKAEVEAR